MRPTRWIAHRGWSARFPENTLPAFAAAWAAGADELELDVRLSADGVPVVLHDPILERVCDLRGPVAERDWAELRSAWVLGRDGEPLPGLGLLDLERALDLFAPRSGLNVHVKVADERILRRIQEAARRHPERHIYVAGDEEVLEAARALCPEVPRCCLARQREPAALLATALAYGCVGLQYVATNYDADAVGEARRHGLFCNLFYADSVQDALEAIAAGIDGILTNDVGPVRVGVGIHHPS